MGRPPELTERDIKLLTTLARCRILHIDQVAQIYGVAHYHVKRVAVLEERGYLRKKGSYIENSLKSFRRVAPGVKRPPALRTSWQREQGSLYSEVFLNLRGWGFEFGLEYKRRKPSVNRGARFGAILSRGGYKYALYVLNSKPKKTTVRVIKHEIRDLTKLNIHRAVILYQADKNNRSTVPRNFPLGDYSVEQLMVLPFERGMRILNHQDDIFNLVHSKVPSARVSERTFVDLEQGRDLICIMTNNDVARMHQLREYIRIVQAKEARQVRILCLRSQHPTISKIFPTVKVLALPENVVFGGVAPGRSS